jgi:energy-coupling factor transport system ATP-binding protein/energy-coupling factor transport system substrate-specific component
VSQRSKKFLKAFYEDREWQGESLKKERHQPRIEVEIWNQPVKKQRLRTRTKVDLLMLVLLTPLVMYWGIHIGDRNYLTVSLIMLVLAMVPFFLVFEGRKPQARELIVIAVLIAIGVAGRGAFFMFPQFKPVAALVIIAAVAFGPETGFLVGSGTALVSNIFFAQGPWTPWQMFAFGILGFIAGLFYRWGLLRANRIALCSFGFFSIFIIYGGIMNPASVLMYTTQVNKEIFLAAYISGAPMDLVHAISTVIFLAVLAKPLLEKLERIKIKYGLL